MHDKPSSAVDTVPPETLTTLVTRATGQVVTTLEPLAQGESTAAYRATTQAADDLIVRVQQRGVIGFAEEAWAMRRCREAGLPVPEVYAVDRVGTDAPRDLMVMAAARGRALTEVMGSLSRAELAQVFAELGKSLRHLHEIPVGNFGWLREADNPSAAKADWPTYARELLAARQEDASALALAGLTHAEVGGLLAIVSHLQTLPYTIPVLCHGDL